MMINCHTYICWSLTYTIPVYRNNLVMINSWVINKCKYKHEKSGCPRGEIGRHKGLKTYEDGREESGEFGIINQGTLKLRTDYIEENRGQLIFGSRRFADGTDENVDKRTLYFF